VATETARMIATLGFEEKYIIRCALRYSQRYRIRSILLYTSTPTDRYAEERVERAFEQARRVLGEYLDINLELARVNPYQLLSNIEEMRSQILEQASMDRVIICISGGLRLIVAALLAAALLIPQPVPGNIEVSIEHDAEQGHVEVPLKALEGFRMLDRRHLNVYYKLREIGPAGVSQLARETGLPKTSVWRILNRLVRDGLAIKDGRRYRART